MRPAAELDLLQAYLDGELPAPAALALEMRLKAEPGLARSLLELARAEAIIARWARASGVAAFQPASICLDGMAAAALGSRRRRLGLWYARASLAAAVLVGVVLASLLSARRFSPPTGGQVPALRGVGEVLARLDQVQGRVELFAATGQKAGADGDPVYADHGILTGPEDGFATLVFGDGTQLDLGPGTRLVLQGGQGKRVLLEEGQLSADVAHQPDGLPMRVLTPHAELTVLGTRFTSVSTSTATRVDLERGAVQLRRMSDGKVIDVQPGSFASTISRFDFSAHPRPVRLTRPLRSLTYPPDRLLGVSFPSTGPGPVTPTRDGWLLAWDLAGRAGRVFPTPLLRNCSCVKLSADGSLLAAGFRDRTVRLWDVATGEELAVFAGLKDNSASTFSPDLRYLAAGGWDREGKGSAGGTFRVWDVFARHEVLTRQPARKPIRSMVFAPDSRTLILGSDDGALDLWDVVEGKRLASLAGHAREVTALAIDRPGRLLASGSSDGLIKLWDLHELTERFERLGPTMSVRSLAFSPDDLTLAAGTGRGVALLWEVATGRELVSFAGQGKQASVAYSPDGRYLATAGGDYSIRLWNLDPASWVVPPRAAKARR